MREVELEADISKLEKYQAESLIGQLGVVQLHLEDIYGGKALALCRDCLGGKHLPTIIVLANECVGICRLDSLWRDIADWARQFKDSKLSSEYLGQDKQETLELRNQARTFRKRLAEITRSNSKKQEVGGENMKRGLSEFLPRKGYLSESEPETQQETNKKPRSLLPWVLLVAAGGGIWYFWQKRKTTQALAQTKQADLEAQAQAEAQPGQKGQGNHPGLKIRSQGGQISPNNRLKAILDQED